MKRIEGLLTRFASASKPKLRPSLRLDGRSDLPSIRESINIHKDRLHRGTSIKTATISDSQTYSIAEKILRAQTERGLPESKTSSTFLEANLFGQPDLSSNAAGSIKVLIADIKDFPECKRQYDLQKHKNSMLCVGGPAAEDQVILAGIIKQIRERLDDIVYITRDYQESNVTHSAKQSHARHGNALNADESLSGHKLLPILLIRKLLGVELEDVMEPDYIKIDVAFTIDQKKLRIYFGNELNWLKQEYKKRNGELNEHDINRLESVLSQEILIAIEKQTGLRISGGLERARQDPSSIHVNFNAQEEKHLQAEMGDLKKVGIESRKLSSEKSRFFFGENEHIHSAYEYPGDGYILFDDHQSNQELAEENGVLWMDGVEVSRIFVTQNDLGNAEVAGVLTSDGEYFYCNKLHFTGGYKVDYDFDPESKSRFQSSVIRNILNMLEDHLGLSKPLGSNITTATGVSINAVFKKSERLRRIIERYGSTGEIAVTNSHWTMIAEDDEHILMRITGGGNTGSEEYNPAYFLNVMANTRRIFGDDLIGILSTYGCPRAVNAKNSSEFAKIAEGGIISYGKGGTGNTKRHTEAAFGLMMVGFEREVVDYFNQFQTSKGNPLGDDLLKIYEMAKNIEFFHDNLQKTNRRMGYDSSFSMSEMLLLGAFVSALSVGVVNGLISTKSSSKEI
ncbi:MAG: hypothetical protein K0R25_209 [Rickettsiaceae bacterium]|jgi:hypothetical protein|nr:hypothetical protein [Rickettsiaceae bacterium]